MPKNMPRNIDVSNQPIFVIYKVTDWRKYWYNDPDAMLIANGLTGWKARQRMRELNSNDFDGPLHPDGRPIGRYKLCTQNDWDKDRKRFTEQNLFREEQL